MAHDPVLLNQMIEEKKVGWKGFLSFPGFVHLSPTAKLDRSRHPSLNSSRLDPGSTTRFEQRLFLLVVRGRPSVCLRPGPNDLLADLPVHPPG